MNDNQTPDREIVYTTATDEDGKWLRKEEPDARPVIRRRRRPTTKERWFSTTNTSAKSSDPDADIAAQISPKMLKLIHDYLEPFEMRLSDCTFNPDGSIILPNHPKKRDSNAR